MLYEVITIAMLTYDVREHTEKDGSEGEQRADARERETLR